MRSGIYVLLAVCLFFAFSAAAKDGDEDGKEVPEGLTYLFPPGAYPVVEVFAGASNGITYREGVYRSAKRADGAGNVGGTLKDIGETFDYGVNFRFVMFSRFDFAISVFHQDGKKRETVFRYDYSAVDPYVKPPQYVDDYISYKANNLDCKLRTGFDPFPDFYVAPYVSAGIGLNFMRVTARNYIPGKKTNLTFFYPGNETVGHFSFDYALYGGVRINFTGYMYIYGEAFYDHPFSNHYYFEYLLETGSKGIHGGLGIRFR